MRNLYIKKRNKQRSNLIVARNIAAISSKALVKDMVCRLTTYRYLKISIALLVISLFNIGCKKEKEIIPVNNDVSAVYLTSSSENVVSKKLTPRQLFYEDLKRGDIMLKVWAPNEVFSNRIRYAQKITGQVDYEITHTGIISDIKGDVTIIEADATTGGLLKHSLRENLEENYIVYRCTNPQMADGAATAAELLSDIHKANRTIPYPSKIKLLPSILFKGGNAKSDQEIEELFTKLMNGKSTPMFCSQFVTFVFQWAASQLGISPKDVFKMNDKKVCPARLAEMLQNNPYFEEVGYMISGEQNNPI